MDGKKRGERIRGLLHKREEIRELEEEIVESSRTVEQLRKIELKMNKNASYAKRDVEKVRDSLQFIESEVRVKNTTISELRWRAIESAQKCLSAMEKFVSALHETRENIRHKIHVAQSETTKEKSFSVGFGNARKRVFENVERCGKKMRRSEAKIRQRRKASVGRENARSQRVHPRT